MVCPRFFGVVKVAVATKMSAREKSGSNRSNGKKTKSEEKPVTFEDIPTDVMMDIAKKLSQKDIRSLASTSKSVATSLKRKSEYMYREKFMMEYGIVDWKTAYETFDYLANKHPESAIYIHKMNLRNLQPTLQCPNNSISTKILSDLVTSQTNDTLRDNGHRSRLLFKAVRIFMFVDHCFAALKGIMMDNPIMTINMYNKLKEFRDVAIPEGRLSGKLKNKWIIQEFYAVAERLMPKLEAILRRR